MLIYNHIWPKLKGLIIMIANIIHSLKTITYRIGTISGTKTKKGINQNDDDLILLIFRCVWFGMYNHKKREHMETIIQRVSFPLFIELKSWWIKDGFGSTVLILERLLTGFLQFKSLFQESPRTYAVGIWILSLNTYIIQTSLTQSLCILTFLN